MALAGDGQLVLLLHDFPQFWWAWRHQLVALAGAGFPGRGDRPARVRRVRQTPAGYDTYTATADAAAVIRSLGERTPSIVGAGLGAWTAWAMPSLRPESTRAIGALGMPHPAVMQRYAALQPGAAQGHAIRRASLPMAIPARRAPWSRRRPGCGYYLLEPAPGGTFPSEEDIARYAAALALPFVAHSTRQVLPLDRTQPTAWRRTITGAGSSRRADAGRARCPG